MSALVRIAWHISGLFICGWGFTKLDIMQELAGVDISQQYGTHWQFLTVCSLPATLVTLSLALSADLLEFLYGAVSTADQAKGSKKTKRVASPAGAVWDGLADAIGFAKTVLSLITTPTEALVSILFWTILAYDPSLVSPN